MALGNCIDRTTVVRQYTEGSKRASYESASHFHREYKLAESFHILVDILLGQLTADGHCLSTQYGAMAL